MPTSIRRSRLLAGALLASSTALLGAGIAGADTGATGHETDLQWTVPNGVEVVQLHLIGGAGGAGGESGPRGGAGCEIYVSVATEAGGLVKLVGGQNGHDGETANGGAGGAGVVSGVLSATGLGGNGGNGGAGGLLGGLGGNGGNGGVGGSSVPDMLSGGAGGSAPAGDGGGGGGGGASVGGFSPVGQSSSTGGAVAAGGGGGGGQDGSSGGDGCTGLSFNGADGGGGSAGGGGATNPPVTPGAAGTNSGGDGQPGATTDSGGTGNGGAGGTTTTSGDSGGGGGGGGVAGGGGGAAYEYDEGGGGGAGASAVEGQVTDTWGLIHPAAFGATPVAEMNYVNITTPSVPPIVAGQAYSAQLEAVYGTTADRSGGRMVWSVSPALPAGLKLNSSTGLISGTPTATADATQYRFTAQWRLVPQGAGRLSAASTILVAQSSIESSLSPTTTSTAATLPKTGGQTSGLMVLGGLLGLGGAGLLLWRRRVV